MKIATISSVNFTGNSTKPKKTKNIKESYLASAASSAAGLVSMPVGTAVINKIQKINDGLTPEQLKTVQESANKMLKGTGLAEKGVSIITLEKADSSNLATASDKIMDKLLELLSPVGSAKKGKNAFFASKEILDVCDKNSVCMPSDGKFSLTAFHELGHAHNYNISKVGKLLWNAKGSGTTIATLLTVFAAFTREAKAQDGKELTKGQKTKNFVRKNAGLLTFAAMTPMLAEEAMASIKGCKWANANMAQDLAKKVSKTNVVAYCSYLALAVGSALSAHVAVKVKDKLVAKKEAKLAASQANSSSQH